MGIGFILLGRPTISFRSAGAQTLLVHTDLGIGCQLFEVDQLKKIKQQDSINVVEWDIRILKAYQGFSPHPPILYQSKLMGYILSVFLPLFSFSELGGNLF